jgi:hypothetical protein
MWVKYDKQYPLRKGNNRVNIGCTDNDVPDLIYGILGIAVVLYELAGIVAIRFL